MQRRADREANARQVAREDQMQAEDARGKRNALLTYLAAEIRRNYGMTTGMASLVAKAGTMDFPDSPYYPAGLDDQAYHACLGKPESRMDLDKELLDALVDCYSAIPVWRSFEQQLALETRSGDVLQTTRAWLHAATMKEALDGQAERFLNLHRLLQKRGISAQAPISNPGSAVPQST